MQCQNCGQVNMAGARFCKTCGQMLPAEPIGGPPPIPSQSISPTGAPVSMPPLYPASPPQSPVWNAPAVPPLASLSSKRVLRKVSPLSVLKVVAIIYGLMFAIFGCFFILLPGIIGGGLLGDLGFGDLGGGGILITLLVYVVSTLIGGVTAGVSAAIAALLYNLVSRYVGGVEVEIDSLP